MTNIENLIPIPGRLHSVATEGHVAGADEIYDDSLQKDQATINSEVNTALGTGGTVDQKIATAKSEVIGDAATDYNTLGKIEDKIEGLDVAYIDRTESSPAVVPSFDPESQKVHVTAQTLSEQQKAQVRDNIGLGDVDTKINEAVASEASQRTEAVYGVQASVNAETSRAQTAENTLNQKLSLLNGSEVIVVENHTQVSSPDSQKVYREQGESSYTDWMYQNNEWKEIATYNHDIDNVPTAGSDNLVKSGGVFAELQKINNGITYNSSILTENAYYYINKSMDGHFPSDTPTTLQNYYCVQIPVFVGDILVVTSSTNGNSNALAYGIYSNIGKQLESETYNSEVNTFTLNIKQDGFVRVNCTIDNLSKFKVIRYNGTQKNDYVFSIIQKILCVGDSMTDGYMWNDTDNEYQVHREYSYPTILTKLTNVETVNEGHSGITAKGWYDAFGELDFSTCDYAFIFLGKNGGLTDTLETDVYPYVDYHDYADTNTGCYCKIIKSLKAKRANVKIVLINGLTLDSTTQKVIKFIGEHYNIPVISLDDDSIYDLSNFDVYHHKDTTHFNAIGYATLAKYILYKVANTIRFNYSIYDNGN